MKQNKIHVFIYSAGMLLLFTALAKIISSFVSARILQTPDPILALPYRYLFWGVGALELTVAAICFFSNRVGLQSGFVAWLATSFFLYRISMIFAGYHKPCSCLGNLTDALHIPPQTADTAMKIILAYLLIGSYASLFWLWRQNCKAISASAPAQ